MCNTVKLGNKELFDKEQIGTYEGTISSDQFAIYLIRIRNNFRATKKFLIAKFDCIMCFYFLPVLRAIEQNQASN